MAGTMWSRILINPRSLVGIMSCCSRWQEKEVQKVKIAQEVEGIG
jgi:hypothetical protein